MASRAMAAAPSRGIISVYKNFRVDPKLQAAIDSTVHESFAVRVRAMRILELDMNLPERERLGMDQIASLFAVGRDVLDEWWSAYQEGGVDALRNYIEEGGGRPGAGANAPGKAKGGMPTRGAKSVTSEEAGRRGGKTNWERVCLACAIKAGLVRPVRWHYGSGRVPLPGRRGQSMDMADLPPRPPQRRFQCKCRGKCRTEDDRITRNCGCEPSRQCSCPCCRPLKPPPFGPPHAPGCPAVEVSNTLRVVAPADLHRAIKERSGIDYSPDQLRALMEGLEMLPEGAA